jgi:hypothetical protein
MGKHGYFGHKIRIAATNMCGFDMICHSKIQYFWICQTFHGRRNVTNKNKGCNVNPGLINHGLLIRGVLLQ